VVKRLASWWFLGLGLFFVVAVMLLLFLWALQSGNAALVWWGMASVGLVGLSCFVVVWVLAGKLDQAKAERDQVHHELDQVKAERDQVHHELDQVKAELDHVHGVGLSDREAKVMLYRMAGLTLETMASLEHVSKRTIDEDIKSLKAKGAICA